MALQLKKAGFRLVRPLEGGLAAWRGQGMPIEDILVKVSEIVAPAAEK